jgi:hypothetical protein
MTTDKQKAAIAALAKKLDATDYNISTNLGGGTVAVVYWRRGEVMSAGRYHVTRTGNTKALDQ